MNDIIINKTQSLQRCIARAREENELAHEDLGSDLTRQDAAILNITRACELSIDLANYLIKQKRLGIPTDSRESFELLENARIISPELSGRLQSMVGFRNVAVHDYRQLDMDIVKWVIGEGLNELLSFADEVRRALDK